MLLGGVNLPCHLVIVKGTEFYDGKTHRYVDMPVTDVLQVIYYDLFITNMMSLIPHMICADDGSCGKAAV